MIKLLKMAKPYLPYIILSLILLLAQSIAELFLPTLNASIINDGIAKGNTTVIWQLGGIMLLVTIVMAACAILVSFFSARTSMRFGRDLRKALFYKVQSLSQQEMDTFSTPSLITRGTNDVQQVQMILMMGLRMMAMAPIMCIGGIIMALRQDVGLSWILLVILPIMVGFVVLLATKIRPLFEEVQKRLDRLNQVAREKLAGVRVIRAFVRVNYEEKRFDTANRDMADMNFKIAKVMSGMFPVMTLLFSFASLIVTWLGAHRIDAGSLTVGNLTAFISYVMQIMGSVMMSNMIFMMLPRALASAGRINEVLNTEPAIVDHPKQNTMTGRDGLVFSNVTFSYPDADEAVLSDISFEVKPGQTTAIIGSTGSGKSTLINLVPRFFDVTGGQILLNGCDIRDITQEDLRSHIGYVPQKAFLFQGTVADNLRFGKRDATEEDMWRALETAQAADFVKEMEGQLEAEITQGGTNVSGGQRQRLSIARALMGNREVYIFDDSFSALDFKTDAALRQALKEQMADATILVVAQRVSTVLNADQIIVLDNGQVAGVGNHRQLMETCEVYQEIVQSQLTKEEIA